MELHFSERPIHGCQACAKRERTGPDILHPGAHCGRIHFTVAEAPRGEHRLDVRRHRLGVRRPVLEDRVQTATRPCPLGKTVGDIVGDGGRLAGRLADGFAGPRRTHQLHLVTRTAHVRTRRVRSLDKG